MAIKGSLREASLPDVLQLLSLGKKTGCLRIAHWNNFGYVYFEKGWISYASIVNRRDRIGEMLVRAGLVTMDQLQTAIDIHRTRPEHRIGDVLVELGYVSRDTLHEHVRVQIEEAVYLLFTWNEGTFNFEADVLPERQDLLVSISLESLLLEGARRVDEWSLIEKRIPSFDTVFDVEWRKLADSDVPLTPEQRAILQLVDGRRDVNGIVDATGLDEFEVGKALYGLVSAGFVIGLGRRSTLALPAVSEPLIEEHRNLGVAFYRSGMHDEALTQFRKVLDQKKDDTNALFYVGLVLLRKGRWEEAIGTLQGAAGRPGATAVAKALERDIAAAQEHFEQALAVDPDNSLVHFYLGEVAYSRGLNEEALSLLQRAVALDAKNHEALHLLGFVLGDMGRHDEAREATRHAIQLNPSLSLAPAQSRERYVGKAQRDAQLEAKAARLEHFHVGLAFREKGYHAEAIGEFQLALRHGEDRDLVEQAMAEAYLLSGDSASALHLYDALLTRKPESPKFWNERGVALHQGGRYAEAQESYRRAITCDPNYAPSLNNLGVALYHTGDSASAFDAFQRAIDGSSVPVKALLNQALLLYKGKRLQQSIEAYRRALQLESENPAAWNGIGLVLVELKKFHDARAAFARAIQARPKFAEARYNLSFALSNLGNFEAALRETKLALELDPYYVAQKFGLAIDLQNEDPNLAIHPDLTGEERPDVRVEDFAFDPSVLDTLFVDPAPSGSPGAAVPAADPFAKAVDLFAEGLLDRARDEAMHALAAGADPVRGGTLVGDTFAKQALWGEALERYREVRLVAPDATGAMVGEATALLRLGRAMEALPVAEALLPRLPNDVDVMLLVAMARGEAGQAAGARAALDSAVGIAPERPDVHRRLGDLAQQLGDADAAIAAYRTALNLDPQFVVARCELAQVLMARGAWMEAEGELLLALDGAPMFAEAVIALAHVRRKAGRPREALPPLIELLQRDLYHFDALMVLGEALRECNRKPDAMLAFQRVLRFDPTHLGALFSEGTILAEQACHQAAMDRFQRVIELAPASEYAGRARSGIQSTIDTMRSRAQAAG